MASVMGCMISNKFHPYKMPRAYGTATGSVPTINGQNRSELKIRLRAEARVRSLATKVKKKNKVFLEIL